MKIPNPKIQTAEYAEHAEEALMFQTAKSANYAKMGNVLIRRFGELPVGARFCFRARRYEKVAPEIGRDEERGGNVFHASTEVLAEAPKAEPGRTTKVERRATVCPSRQPPPMKDEPRAKELPLRMPYQYALQAQRVQSRRERRDDRVFKPLGTI
jgi:hypothetical protein